MIRLLDKKIIRDEANASTKKQIDEGVQIARKVDKLRQELASLEQQRETFFKGSKFELEKAIGLLQEKKAALESELVRLENLRKEKLKPLDDAWAEVKEKAKALAKEWEEFNLKKDELQKTTEGIEKVKKQVESSQSIAREEERTARRLNREADEREKKSKTLHDNAVKEYAQYREAIGKESRELTIREREADGMAKALDRREKALFNREKLLNDRERFINDKYETLQRTINRLKN